MAVARGDYQVGVVRKFNQFIIDCDWLEVSSSDHVCTDRRTYLEWNCYTDVLQRIASRTRDRPITELKYYY